MKVINISNELKSEVKFRIDRFPDGEVQFLFTEELNRKEDYTVNCRITNAEELFLLLHVGDILDRNGVIWNLHISYLMGMRMDRVMDFNRPFTLSIVAKQISAMGYQKCYIETAHSMRTMMEIRDSVSLERKPYDFIADHFDENNDNVWLVFPDHGAMERYQGSDIDLFFDKTRDIATGKIMSFVLHDVESKSKKEKFLFYDDLCDAGGTFLGELAVLKDKYPDAEFYIRVTHLVNEKGLDNLCKNFDKVYVTDSYRDWSSVAKEKGYTNLVID